MTRRASYCRILKDHDHSACAAQTAEERNLPEFVNGGVVCHHLVRLQTQTFVIVVYRYISNWTEASHRDPLRPHRVSLETRRLPRWGEILDLPLAFPVVIICHRA